jgi:pantetheine-phosphate adenylyltransferase
VNNLEPSEASSTVGSVSPVGGVKSGRRAVCPGSFDPVTNGHLDIFVRASRLYDEVIVAVLVNQSKNGLFSHDERIEMLTKVTAELPNVRIASFEGLLVDFCRTEGIAVVVKGLRAVTDFDYELKMAQMNFGLSGLETLFMPTNPLYSFLSSSLIKDVAKWGGDVSPHVPALVVDRLKARLAESRRHGAGDPRG